MWHGVPGAAACRRLAGQRKVGVAGMQAPWPMVAAGEPEGRDHAGERRRRHDSGGSSRARRSSDMAAVDQDEAIGDFGSRLRRWIGSALKLREVVRSARSRRIMRWG